MPSRVASSYVMWHRLELFGKRDPHLRKFPHQTTLVGKYIFVEGGVWLVDLVLFIDGLMRLGPSHRGSTNTGYVVLGAVRKQMNKP